MDDELRAALLHTTIGTIRAFMRTRPDIYQHLHGRARYSAAAHVSVEGKTYDHYLRQIGDAVKDLWNGDITQDGFVDLMADIIAAQLRKAWNEGMRNNGLDPQADMTEEWEDIFQEIVANEYTFVDGFAADIMKQREAQTEPGSVPAGLVNRESMWANRYNDVVNQSQLITASKGQKYEWRYGDTVEHCETCSALNGVVAYKEEWEQSGLKPQDHELLACHGYNCHCTLEPTTKRRSADALGRLLDIATSGKV